MSSVSSPAALPQFISQLLGQRQAHVASIATIDATLSRVTAALGGTAAKSGAVSAAPKAAPKRRAKRGTKAKPAAAKPAAPAPAKTAPAAKAPVKKAAKSGLTAHEFVLGFVTSAKSPTTQDVNKHWKTSGRLGNADNTLSQLTKLKKLKRSPLPGGVRGSQYAIA